MQLRQRDSPTAQENGYRYNKGLQS